MFKGVNICHFPYRTGAENVYFFAEKGFDSVSQHGFFFLSDISDPVTRAKFTQALQNTGMRFSVHHLLPNSRNNYTPEIFAKHMETFRGWQDETGLLWNLSFDVYPDIRPRASSCIRIALDAFRGTDTKISVEDYGLSPEEKEDLEALRGEEAFGFLVDIGHMNVRLCNTGKKWGHAALEQWGEAYPLPPGNNSPEAFRNALQAKDFPIYEIHLHNNSGCGDEHRWLEEGNIDMQGLARILKDLEFDGIVSMETVPDWTGTPEHVARQKELEQDVWRYLDRHYRLTPFRGLPDHARDDRYLRSFEFWKRCLENA